VGKESQKKGEEPSFVLLEQMWSKAKEKKKESRISLTSNLLAVNDAYCARGVTTKEKGKGGTHKRRKDTCEQTRKESNTGNQKGG